MMKGIENEEISREEIQGYCEAYQLYLILKKEEQEKIPMDFVEKMNYYSKYEIGPVIDIPSDIKYEEVSRDGIKKMAYMFLHI